MNASKLILLSSYVQIPHDQCCQCNMSSLQQKMSVPYSSQSFPMISLRDNYQRAVFMVQVTSQPPTWNNILQIILTLTSSPITRKKTILSSLKHLWISTWKYWICPNTNIHQTLALASSGTLLLLVLFL